MGLCGGAGFKFGAGQALLVRNFDPFSNFGTIVRSEFLGLWSTLLEAGTCLLAN